VHRLEFYNVDAMTDIVRRSAGLLKSPIDEEAAVEIARRSRGTPRVVNRLLKRVRDFALVMADNHITVEVARAALASLEIDDLGLDENDRRVLRTIIETFEGGPVGLSTLAAATAEEVDAIEDVYEPYLLQLGFLQRTPRGRVATRRAYEHMGYPFLERAAPPPDAQQQLLWGE
jgi:Holliday junction DNA helicase RuvB